MLQNNMFKSLMSQLECPDCGGILVKRTYKNYYHGRNSDCRKTTRQVCYHCNYSKLIKIGDSD